MFISVVLISVSYWYLLYCLSFFYLTERNLVEFTAEYGDWRCVILEDEMFICGLTGDLIHPVHVQSNQYVFGSGP